MHLELELSTRALHRIWFLNGIFRANKDQYPLTQYHQAEALGFSCSVKTKIVQDGPFLGHQVLT